MLGPGGPRGSRLPLLSLARHPALRLPVWLGPRGPASSGLSSDPGAQDASRSPPDPGWPAGSRRPLRSRQRGGAGAGPALTRPGPSSGPKSEELRAHTPPRPESRRKTTVPNSSTLLRSSRREPRPRACPLPPNFRVGVLVPALQPSPPLKSSGFISGGFCPQWACMPLNKFRGDSREAGCVFRGSGFLSPVRVRGSLAEHRALGRQNWGFPGVTAAGGAPRQQQGTEQRPQGDTDAEAAGSGVPGGVLGHSTGPHGSVPAPFLAGGCFLRSRCASAVWTRRPSTSC